MQLALTNRFKHSTFTFHMAHTVSQPFLALPPSPPSTPPFRPSPRQLTLPCVSAAPATTRNTSTSTSGRSTPADDLAGTSSPPPSKQATTFPSPPSGRSTGQGPASQAPPTAPSTLPGCKWLPTVNHLHFIHSLVWFSSLFTQALHRYQGPNSP